MRNVTVNRYEILSKFGETDKAGFDRVKSKNAAYDETEIYGIIPQDSSKPYDTYELICRIIDDGDFDEFKPTYGKTIITGYARIDGWAVGIVANQRSIVKSKSGEMQFGGVIYSDSADKAARFILNCNQRKIPILFLQDVTGFLVEKGMKGFTAPEMKGKHSDRKSVV